MLDSYKLRPAVKTDADILSNLAFRSKAFWGYSEEFMDACRHDLTTTEESIVNDDFIVAQNEDGKIIGFYSIEKTLDKASLSNLFIDPDYIGNGLGKILLVHAKETAKSAGFATLEIQADPNAKDFYLHMGAEEVGSIPSRSIPGRNLPKLILNTSS